MTADLYERTMKVMEKSSSHIKGADSQVLLAPKGRKKMFGGGGGEMFECRAGYASPRDGCTESCSCTASVVMVGRCLK